MKNIRPFHLEPIRRVEVYQEVLARLETYIVKNNLQPGDRLPSDRQLAEQLGVSRISVRMAIKVLESFGRVDAQQGSGTFVRNPAPSAAIANLTRGLQYGPDFLVQLAPIRNAIDMAVFEAACQHHTPENLALVWEVVSDRERLMAEESEAGDLIVSFERALGAICGNELLRRMQSLIHQIWVEAWSKIGKAPGDKHLFHKEHIEIFQCIREGNLPQARALFASHLDVARLLESLKSDPSLHGEGGNGRARHRRVAGPAPRARTRATRS